MFDCDRFGSGENFYKTYQLFKGKELEPEFVQKSILNIISITDHYYQNPEYFNAFPKISDIISKYYPNLSDNEKKKLEYVIAYHERGVISPKMVEMLKRLQQKVPLCLMSNIWCQKDLWIDYFKEIGLIEVFDNIVFSSDASFIKPSQKFFKMGLSYYPDINVKDVLFVGDDLFRDIQPAQKLGMQTYQV